MPPPDVTDHIAGLEGMHGISMEQVKAKAENDRKYRPTESDAVSEFGAHRIERNFREDGNYSWRVKADGDKREAERMRGMVSPWAKAEVARIADDQGYPGDYGGGLRGKVMLPPRTISGDWCDGCGSRMVWCECAGAAEAETDSRTDAGRDAAPVSGG